MDLRFRPPHGFFPDPDDLEDTPLSACLKLVFEARRSDLTWDQVQAMKTQIRQLEEAEQRTEAERTEARHRREEQSYAGITWVKD